MTTKTDITPQPACVAAEEYARRNPNYERTDTELYNAFMAGVAWQARAAGEADRQDRTPKPLPELIVTKGGIPFEDQNEGIRQFKEACMAAADAKADRADHLRDATKMVPSDDDLFALHDEYFPTMMLGHDNYLAFARALLSRYSSGHPAKPSNSGELGQPATPPASIPRALLGRIVDEVFDGAIEDSSVIEDIYRVIVREYGRPAASVEPSNDVIRSFDEFSRKYTPKSHEEERLLRDRFKAWLRWDDDVVRYSDQPAASAEPADLPVVAKQMYLALCEELAAYDPPIHHVKAAVDAYLAWKHTAPVAQEPIAAKRITAPTMVDLKAAIYAHHGWTRAAGESMSARIGALYDLAADHRADRFVATPKSVAPVAQEPFMWWRWFNDGRRVTRETWFSDETINKPAGTGWCPLYAAPVAAQAQPWQALAAAMYQAAGAYDMPVRILDALSAAANDESFAHLIDGLLPIECPEPSAQDREDAELTDLGPIRVGNLPTMNQDEYPDLGDWWVQLRIGNDGDEVLARVYGDTPEQARSRAVALACLHAKQIRK